MRSKTSCFNGTLFKKNMARFAPLWLLYTLALLLGLVLMYTENNSSNFWFASNVGEMIQYASIINLVYAPMVAILLFGDLYNSRMCNQLHAMPIKRSGMFTANILSGLVFSLLPTAIFCGASIPLLMQTCVENAWGIGLWAFLGFNLSYLCFFGIAVFSALCVGNRFAMLAVYAILNGGAFIVFFLVDTIYTPMLYGVITPNTLANALTPIANLVEAACVEVENYGYFSNRLARDANAMAIWWLETEGWIIQGIWAAVGAVFTALGWLLYRKRRLECAGDTMATKGLEPVFQIMVSICGAAFFSLFTSMMIGTLEGNIQYIFLASGLVVGWFAARMLIERTVRVFRFKNFLGLAALAAVLTGTLFMTHYDVFGIETWTPKVEEVKSVTFGYSMYRGMSEELTEDEEIAEVIRLHQLALEERLETHGSHVIVDGQRVHAANLDKDARSDKEYVYSTTIYIYYTLENGREVSREYIVWGDGETGAIVNEYLSRWEVICAANFDGYPEIAASTIGDLEVPVQRLALQGNLLPAQFCTDAEIESLLEAMKADCEARKLTQRETFHSGHFRRVNEEGETESFRSFWVDFYTDDGRSGDFYVFADSENTLKWFTDRNLLNFTIHAENSYPG